MADGLGRERFSGITGASLGAEGVPMGAKTGKFFLSEPENGIFSCFMGGD